MAEPTHHVEIVRRVSAVEKDVAVLTEKVDATEAAVRENRSHFTEALDSMTLTQNSIRDSLSEHRGEVRGGLMVLKWGGSIIAVIITVALTIIGYVVV